MPSIIYLLLLPHHSLPSLGAHVISLLSFPFTHAHHFHSNGRQQNCPIPYVCYSAHHFLISTPFIPFRLTTFSLDIFYSLPSNHTNQIACIQHIICRPFCPIPISYILSSTFPYLNHLPFY